MDELLPLNLTESKLLPGRLVIAGPCSAESPDSLLECSRLLAALGCASALRAGAWKPRTRPGSFEGYGSAALPWLREASASTGLPIGTEVATPEHAKQAAEADVDFLWIGARTAANPFAMQQLAEAIAYHCPDKAILVKNPLNPDIELWIGALQRLYLAGVRRLGAIHRGFSVCDASPYRNAPLWQIPLQLHRRFPKLPLLHDPSHTGGTRSLIAPLSQAALDLGFDGLMIECHPDPEQAMSDGGQQITPAELADMLRRLRVRTGSRPDDAIDGLRLQIDELDNQLLSILARRMNLTDSIGRLKRDADMPALQPARYSRLLSTLISRGEAAGLDTRFLHSLLETVHEESIRRQLLILNE